MEIKFQNVEYSYSKNGKKVLDGVNIKIGKERITGITGPSGSGKTTLIEMINALRIPTKGKVIVGDVIVSKKKKIEDIKKFRSKIGMVFQFPEEQFFCDTVDKEIAFGLEQFHYEIEENVILAMEMVDLDMSFLSRDPFSLSNGEMRKVAIASALAYNPEVLILDEPTIGLDMASKKSLIKVLTTIKARYKKTIIIVSHDVDFICKVADDTIVLKDGNVLVSGKSIDVFKEESLLQENDISVPRTITFSNYVLKEKNIYLGYRSEVNDLVKDILRHVK